MKSQTLGTALLSLLLLSTSCATIRQELIIEPMSLGRPVSASSSLIDGERIVGDSDIQTSQKFELVKKVAVPYLAPKASVDFSQELKDALPGFDYNGIYKVKVSVKNVDTSTATWIALERFYGVFSGLSGLYLFAVSSGAPGTQAQLYPAAAGFVASGAVFFGGSFLHENLASIEYTFDVSGVKVKY